MYDSVTGVARLINAGLGGKLSASFPGSVFSRPIPEGVKYWGLGNGLRKSCYYTILVAVFVRACFLLVSKMNSVCNKLNKLTSWQKIEIEL